MLRRFHRTAAYAGFGLIAGFFLSSVIVEIAGDDAAVAFVKRTIFYLIFLLVPVMMTAALTGRALAKTRPDSEVLKHKRRRTPRIALNALFVLIPLATLLFRLSQQGSFGTLFYVLQGAEFLFGALNLFWLRQNMREGSMLAKAR